MIGKLFPLIGNHIAKFIQHYFNIDNFTEQMFPVLDANRHEIISRTPVIPSFQPDGSAMSVNIMAASLRVSFTMRLSFYEFINLR